MGTDTEVEHPVIFFDGVCNLCNASVNFIIKRDKKEYFRFASLQSDYANEMLPHELTRDRLSSLILLSGEIKMRSSAALGIARHLSGLWPILTILKIIPRFVRDPMYNLIAKNRYRLFGKRDECMLPAKELKDRFFD